MTKLELSPIAFLSVTLVLIGVAAQKAEADTIWTYVGNITNTCLAGDCSQSDLQNDSLDLSVTFTGPLGDDLNSVDLNAESDIVSWTLTDTEGFIDFSSTTGGTQLFDSFSTDANGNIVPYTSFTVLSQNFGEADTQAATVQSCEDGGSCDEIFFYDQNADLYGAEALSDGVWSSVPEPSSALLMAMGTGILVVALRCKYRLAGC